MPAKATVTHGIDDSGLSSAKPSRAHNGHTFYATDTATLYVYDETQAEWLIVDTLNFVFDPSANAGQRTVGRHAITGARIPAGTIVVDGMLDVITAFASGGAATVAIGFQAAGDIRAASAMSALNTGLKNIIQLGTAATATKATADRQVVVDVAAAALTAGKLKGFLRVLRSEVVVTEEESSTSSSSSSSNSSSSSCSNSSSLNSSSSCSSSVNSSSSCSASSSNSSSSSSSI